MAGCASGVDHAPLGDTNLRVSRICQGTAFRHLQRGPGDPRSERVLRHCMEAGLTFFDTSYAYGWGGSEELLGRAVAGSRHRAVICTKVPASRAPLKHGTPGEPVSFTHGFLRESLEGSLRRLGTDYLDLFLLHQPDRGTPAAEICRSMDALVRSGKTRYWGVSNHPAHFVQQLHDAARQSGMSPPAAVEDYYNVGGHHLDERGCSRVRRLKREMFPVVRACGIGVIAFSPVDTGQLAPEARPEPGSAAACLHATLDAVAAELGVGRVQVCVAWVLAHPGVDSVLIGAETCAHVDEALAGARLVLPEAARAQLERASITYSEEQEACHSGS